MGGGSSFVVSGDSYSITADSYDPTQDMWIAIEATGSVGLTNCPLNRSGHTD